MSLKFTCYFTTGILVILLLSMKPSAGRVSTRIIGGATTNISNVPYVVQIWLANSFVCGGTLVSPRFVVSAAHCVGGFAPSQFRIKGGATRLRNGGVTRRVVKILVPASFSVRTMHSDVSVFKLRSPMIGANIRPIALNTQPVFQIGMIIRVSGWGLTSENARGPSQQLRSVKVPVMAKARCANMYGNVFRLTRTMFCASTPGVRDACTGDSGGPAVCNGKLCGIVSWGLGCGRRQYPGVYTSVGRVINFIRAAMRH